MAPFDPLFSNLYHHKTLYGAPNSQDNLTVGSLEDTAKAMERRGATKYDSGKPRWELAPMAEFEDVVKIMTFGASKYEDNGWKGVDKQRYISAMLRHLTAYMSGEDTDEESGMSHMAHAACNALFIMWKDKE